MGDNGNLQESGDRGDGGIVHHTTALLPQPGQSHFRQQCRDVVEILTFRRPDGSAVIREEEVTALIRGAVPLAAKAAKDDRARDYRAAMGVLVALAKLEQSDKPQAVDHRHLHMEVDMADLISRIETEVERERAVLDVQPGPAIEPSDNGNGKPSNGEPHA